ncbi:hypothetical protein [Salinarimonas chemoclinalis]|uniref:hypothetical protein n=1 Tax=Salinarimonas chemoclinalis TaxID=3241599 RepID=UPI003556800B
MSAAIATDVRFAALRRRSTVIDMYEPVSFLIATGCHPDRQALERLPTVLVKSRF